MSSLDAYFSRKKNLFITLCIFFNVKSESKSGAYASPRPLVTQDGRADLILSDFHNLEWFLTEVVMASEKFGQYVREPTRKLHIDK